ncbi:hypothetical protein B6U93_02150 [Candidatus Woesearchaeota archaeon ex4484_78]|nr:MAG: hypothetical protein B6U93_02150 [Candidatus Woesearchaeota archaeon ex4484_78]
MPHTNKTTTKIMKKTKGISIRKLQVPKRRTFSKNKERQNKTTNKTPNTLSKILLLAFNNSTKEKRITKKAEIKFFTTSRIIRKCFLKIV